MRGWCYRKLSSGHGLNVEVLKVFLHFRVWDSSPALDGTDTDDGCSFFDVRKHQVVVVSESHVSVTDVCGFSCVSEVFEGVPDCLE